MASTPQVLKAGGAAVTLAALLLAIAAIAGAHTCRNLAVGLGPNDPRRPLIEKLAADAAEHKDLTPELDALGKLNPALPDTVPNRALPLTVGAGLLEGLALVSLQILLTRRTHRVINPGILLATVTAWIFVVFTAQAFQRSERDLRLSRVSQAVSDVANIDQIAPVIALSVIALTWLGLRPRLKEYN
ncbi:MAG: hypothetical protein KGN84_06835 [Acidobacteriota bacterium]|nr:hypothetical protein [Acidobacteriota bacterium]